MLNSKIFFTVVFFKILTFSSAINEYRFIKDSWNPESSNHGFASVSVSRGIFSYLENPALTGKTPNLITGLSSSYSGNHFSFNPAFTSRISNNTVIGLGVLRNNSSIPENRFTFNFSYSFLNYSFGLNSHFLNYSDESLEFQNKTNMDFDFGYIIEPFSKLRHAFTVYNLLSSSFYESYDTVLKTMTSLETSLSLLINESGKSNISVAGGFGNSDEVMNSLNGGVSLSLVFIKEKLGLHSSFNYQKEGKNSFYTKTGFGPSFILNTDAGDYRFSYSSQIIRNSFSSEKNINHYVSIDYSHGIEKDFYKPFGNITTDKNSFTPDGDNVDDFLTVFIEASDNEGGTGLKKWALVICKRPDTEKSSSCDIIKSFSGKGIPPGALKWDGRNSSSTLCAKGDYFLRLRLVDKKNNHFEGPWKKISIE